MHARTRTTSRMQTVGLHQQLALAALELEELELETLALEVLELEALALGALELEALELLTEELEVLVLGVLRLAVLMLEALCSGARFSFRRYRRLYRHLTQSFTRPDISFSVGQLARVVHNPSEEHLDAAECVVKYLNSHPSIGVRYSASAQVKQKGVELLKEKGERLGEGKLFLTCFTDASWGSEKEDSSSVGGYICVVGGGPVSWRSKKQTETALFSMTQSTS
ncbi:unnamed protein product [Closterium sp. NIES-53]